MGGMAAAIEAYRSAPTPNVIILETEGRNDILAGLDQLASVCDAGTRVIVIGRVNDVTLYRELVRRGVSDYVIAPVDALDVVRSICSLFSAPEAKAVGRIIAIVGAKGGVGASTIAHNVAWAIARDLALDSVVADLDLAFGTAGSTTTRIRRGLVPCAAAAVGGDSGCSRRRASKARSRSATTKSSARSRAIAQATLWAMVEAPTPPLAPTMAMGGASASDAENRLQIERTASSAVTGAME